MVEKSSQRTVIVSRAEALDRVIPPLGSVVSISTLTSLVDGMDVHDVEKILRCEVRKICRGVYSLVTRSRSPLTPSLIYLAFRYCPTYAYYVRSLTTLLVTREQLRSLLLGVLAHITYMSILRKRLRNSIVIPEACIEGEFMGIEVRGRIDLLVHVPEKLILRRWGAIGRGGQLYLVEVKTARRGGRTEQAALVQAFIYRRLLDIEAIPIAVMRDWAGTGTVDWTVIETVAERIARWRRPPDPEWGRDYCPYCPLTKLKICEHRFLSKRKSRRGGK